MIFQNTKKLNICKQRIEWEVPAEKQVVLDNTEKNEVNGGTEPRDRLSSLLSSLASLNLYSFPENTLVFAGRAISHMSDSFPFHLVIVCELDT